MHARARHSCTELYVSSQPTTWHCGTRRAREMAREFGGRKKRTRFRSEASKPSARKRSDRENRADCGLEDTVETRRGRRGRVTRGPAGGSRARSRVAPGRRGGRTTRAFSSLLRFGASSFRAAGASALVDVATVGGMLRCAGAEAGFLARGRGDARARPGVSRRESRWSATSREGCAPSRERRGDSPCGSRAARGNLPVRASVERASSRVPFSHARRAGKRRPCFCFRVFQTKNMGEWEISFFICGFSRLRT